MARRRSPPAPSVGRCRGKKRRLVKAKQSRESSKNFSVALGEKILRPGRRNRRAHIGREKTAIRQERGEHAFQPLLQREGAEQK